MEPSRLGAWAVPGVTLQVPEVPLIPVTCQVVDTVSTVVFQPKVLASSGIGEPSLPVNGGALLPDPIPLLPVGGGVVVA